ncbi:unnamed protein product, partial [Enterobius vermicularis]|uniref:G-patch domain-containing protein n=1 Tax=Enterobius vermicularis TaxID=51028 RepID=A0A158QBC2_ENTVE
WYKSNIETFLDVSYAIIRNIPKQFHAKDLRHYFSEYVENGHFKCFHYRHRPEIHVIFSGRSAENLNSSAAGRYCCIVSFNDEEIREKFKKDFHGKFWSDAEGNELGCRCYVFFVKISAALEADVLTKLDLSAMIEFRPPEVMPFGNVGTPTDYFLEQIRLCKLPARLVGKLGLKPPRHIKMYGAVPLTYPSSSLFADMIEKLEVEETEDDNDECEEWERHEALHNDITEQDRGPGLVWYTDTSFWQEAEEGTDTDWKWADDWDVDYSVYYDKSSSTLDARQAVEIFEDEKLRSLTFSVHNGKNTLKEHRDDYLPFGGFEKHTKGVGSKILKRFGWKPGKGLGKKECGKVEAISEEVEEVGGVRISMKRAGVGYHGERLQRTDECC